MKSTMFKKNDIMLITKEVRGFSGLRWPAGTQIRILNVGDAENDLVVIELPDREHHWINKIYLTSHLRKEIIMIEFESGDEVRLTRDIKFKDGTVLTENLCGILDTSWTVPEGFEQILISDEWYIIPTDALVLVNNLSPGATVKLTGTVENISDIGVSVRLSNKNLEIFKQEDLEVEDE